MACRAIFRTVFLSEPRRVNGFLRQARSLAFNGFASVPDRVCRLYCTHNDQCEQEPPQEYVIKAISEVSKTNVIVGGNVSSSSSSSADDSTKQWLELDQQVNTYPTDRGFTAIGIGGDDFANAMVVAVESVIERNIPKDCVKQTLSSKGKYVSVNIGPIRVLTSEQVQAVYNAMKRDERVKYFL
ncbi:unnamed protein product [Cochlearia groenlandica]